MITYIYSFNYIFYNSAAVEALRLALLTHLFRWHCKE